MKLRLENIGKLTKADIEINGITVIAGANGTGKSTVGRALFAVFNGLHDIDEQVNQEKFISIRKILNELLRNLKIDDSESLEDHFKFIDAIKEDVNGNKKAINIKKVISGLYERENKQWDKIVNDSIFVHGIKQIEEVLAISSEELYTFILNRAIYYEYGRQINNVFSEETGSITLTIKGENIKIPIDNNKVTCVINAQSLSKSAVYIDDPFVLDEVNERYFSGRNRSLYHRDLLKNKLLYEYSDSNIIDEVIADKRLKRIYDKISIACSGNIINNKSGPGFDYQLANSDKVLDVKNLSTGLKTFAILKRLLVSGGIESNGTIILDEPEIHLHPEWQLLFAELIVLLHKEFELHILLNTHSPYFLRAIQVYSSIHEVADKCNYYASELSDDETAVITNVTGNVEVIYKKLAEPLQKLEDLRWTE